MSVDPRLRRRTALALSTTALVAVAGCDDGSSDGPEATPTPDPDVALVDRVLQQLGAAERVARAGGADELAALHRAHIEALDGTPPTGTASRRSASGAAVRSSEQRLQDHLESAALAAGSGALARLLASMSAAVGQRLAGRRA